MKKFIISLLTLVTFAAIIPANAQQRFGYQGENPTTGQVGVGGAPIGQNPTRGVGGAPINGTTRNRFGHRGENPTSNQNGTWRNRHQGTRANQMPQSNR